VDVGEARPTEPEETDWQEESAIASHPHPSFRAASSIGIGDVLSIVAFLKWVQESSEDTTDAEAKEGEPSLADIEAVSFGENEGKGFIEKEDDAINEAVVNGGTEGDGFGAQEADWSCQGDFEEVNQ